MNIITIYSGIAPALTEETLLWKLTMLWLIIKQKILILKANDTVIDLYVCMSSDSKMVTYKFYI